jgi:ABC-2 type transport system ATP-binding protein
MHIEGLSKSFGKKQVLKDISFDTYAGEVFGFLGPNGAGKTTLIKIAVGHLTLDEGKISICGHDLKGEYESAMAKVGGIVENPEFYKYLSGYDNLMQFARLYPDVTDERIKKIVHMVGLDNRINDKVKKYSLGMRQRLGVALALLHSPKLLILDEPTNGLDPAGIKELRDVLVRIAHEEGASVLVSSHLMSEMEMMCDRVGVIVNGSLVDVKPREELVSAVAVDKIDVVIGVSDSERALSAVEFIADGDKIAVDGETIEIVMPKKDSRALLYRINRAIIESGVEIATVSHRENKRLEDVFIEITETEGGGQIE